MASNFFLLLSQQTSKNKESKESKEKESKKGKGSTSKAERKRSGGWLTNARSFFFVNTYIHIVSNFCLI